VITGEIKSKFDKIWGAILPLSMSTPVSTVEQLTDLLLHPPARSIAISEIYAERVYSLRFLGSIKTIKPRRRMRARTTKKSQLRFLDRDFPTTWLSGLKVDEIGSSDLSKFNAETAQ